jgi:hypothetical protein
VKVLKSSTKRLNNYLKKDPMGIIYLMAFLGCISLLFVYVCLSKVYEEAYTTRLSCNRSICIIEKETILGQKDVQKYLTFSELSLIKLAKFKNFLFQDMYYLAFEDPETQVHYLITNETNTTTEQEEYIMEIAQFMNMERAMLVLENPRYKMKFIGLSLASAAGLIATFFFIDCIKGILKIRKEQKRKRSYQSILGSGRY